MKKQINAKDVARESGVSSATVSYVLNASSNVTISEQTRKRVLEAVQRLGYVPNQAAKTLGTARTPGNLQSNLIGVVIPQTEPGKEFMFSNPFYADFLSAMEYTARANGYQLLLTGTNVNQSYIEIARKWSLDGIVILGMYPTDEILEYKQSGIPTVLVDCYCNDHFFHSVGTNDRHGGYLATQYLIAKGHRRIAFVSGSVEAHGVNWERLQGYYDALREAGLPGDKSLVFSGSVGYEYGIAAAALIAGSKPAATAAFATADILAIGLVKGLQDMRLSVPDDVSIVGFDDLYLAQTCNPSLTTVRQDIRKKGEEAVKIIIESVKVRGLPKRDITIPLEIIERHSVRDILPSPEQK